MVDSNLTGGVRAVLDQLQRDAIVLDEMRPVECEKTLPAALDASGAEVDAVEFRGLAQQELRPSTEPRGDL